MPKITQAQKQENLEAVTTVIASLAALGIAQSRKEICRAAEVSPYFFSRQAEAEKRYQEYVKGLQGGAAIAPVAVQPDQSRRGALLQYLKLRPGMPFDELAKTLWPVQPKAKARLLLIALAEDCGATITNDLHGIRVFPPGHRFPRPSKGVSEARSNDCKTWIDPTKIDHSLPPSKVFPKGANAFGGQQRQAIAREERVRAEMERMRNSGQILSARALLIAAGVGVTYFQHKTELKREFEKLCQEIRAEQEQEAQRLRMQAIAAKPVQQRQRAIASSIVPDGVLRIRKNDTVTHLDSEAEEQLARLLAELNELNTALLWPECPRKAVQQRVEEVNEAIALLSVEVNHE